MKPNPEKCRLKLNVLIILLFVALIIVFSAAEKFEIFGCGLGDKLGIGEQEAKRITTITKVLLPEEIKKTKILRFSSSSNNHIIETPNSHFVWGLNENQRLSKAVFNDRLKFSIPQEIPKNMSLSDGKFVDPKTERMILNFDEFTFVMERNITEIKKRTLERITLDLVGFPNNLNTLIPGATQYQFSAEKYTSGIVGPFSRSLHNNLLFRFGLSGTVSLDTRSFNNYVKYFQPEIQDLKQINYPGAEVGLRNTMELYIKSINATIDPRILGLQLESEEFIRTKNAEGTPRTEIYGEKLLELKMKDDLRFRFFKNIFNGPKLQGTIVLTREDTFLGFGNNNFNILGFSGAEMNQDFVFPPRIIESFPKIDEIKQISIGFTHTLVLLRNNSVLGIGSNLNGELGRNDVGIDVYRSFIQIKFPENEEICLKAQTCTIELVAAEKDVSFFVFNYGPENHVNFGPICFGKSHLDVKSCSSGGFCAKNDKCECFLSNSGDECELFNSGCSNLNYCSKHGYCDYSKCICYEFATGESCQTPVCNGLPSTDGNVCSSHGKCIFNENDSGTKCVCDPGFNGTFCGDLPDLVLYYSGKAGNLKKIESEFKRISFTHTQASKQPEIKHFSVNQYQGTMSFTIDQILHTWGFFPFSPGEMENVAHISAFPSNSWQAMKTNEKIVEVVSGIDDTWVKSSSGGWRSIGYRNGRIRNLFSQNEKTLFGATNVIPQRRMLWYIDAEGNLARYTSKNETTPQIVLETPEQTKPKKLAKFCENFSILDGEYDAIHSFDGKHNHFFLTSEGVGAELLKYQVDNTEILLSTAADLDGEQQIGTIHDMRCPENNLVVYNGKDWFSFGKNPYYHLGHEKSQEFGIVKFVIPDHETLHWSIGTKHSIILARNSKTMKKSIWVIGENSVYNEFGWNNAPKFSNIPIKVELDPSVSIESITKVFAGNGFSIIGKWKTSEESDKQFGICNGIPGYLTGLSCSSSEKGICDISDICKCRKESFTNYVDLTDLQKRIVDLTRLRFRFSFLFLKFDVRPMDLVSWRLESLRETPDSNNCEIRQSRIAEFDLWVNLITTLLWIILIIVIGCVIFLCCGTISVIFLALSGIVVITSIVGTCLAVVTSVPSFFCCLKCCLKRQRQKDKNEMLQKLLPQQGQEMDEKGNDNLFEKIDLSFFSVEFNDYKIEKDIPGGGSGALCFVARQQKTKEKVFMKMFVLKSLNDEQYDMSEFLNEIKLFSRLRNSNIVDFHGFFCAPPSRVGYVCEFCEKGTLSNFIQKLKTNKTQKFDLSKKIKYLLDISKGMRYLHTKGIIFRDLKPENILIGSNDVLKITDFGISRIVNDNDQKSKNQMTAKVGTSFYKAPEVTQGKSDYNSKVDVFAFGIMIFEVLFETMEPFGSSIPFNVDVQISLDPNFRPKVPSSWKEMFSKDDEKNVETLLELMQKCWDQNPNVRPDFAEIVINLTVVEGHLSGNEQID